MASCATTWVISRFESEHDCAPLRAPPSAVLVSRQMIEYRQLPNFPGGGAHLESSTTTSGWILSASAREQLPSSPLLSSPPSFFSTFCLLSRIPRNPFKMSYAMWIKFATFWSGCQDVRPREMTLPPRLWCRDAPRMSPHTHADCRG